MENFFSRLKRQTSFHREASGSSAGFLGKDNSFEDDLIEEDEGFVIVGQTPGKRSDGSGHLTCKVTSNSLPSFNQVIRTENTMHQSPPAFNTVVMSKEVSSPVGDIPFKFHPTVDIQQHISEIFDGVNLETQQFNWAKYSHDFTKEKLCLRDLKSGEDANVVFD